MLRLIRLSSVVHVSVCHDCAKFHSVFIMFLWLLNSPYAVAADQKDGPGMDSSLSGGRGVVMFCGYTKLQCMLGPD